MVGSSRILFFFRRPRCLRARGSHRHHWVVLQVLPQQTSPLFFFVLFKQQQEPVQTFPVRARGRRVWGGYPVWHARGGIS